MNRLSFYLAVAALVLFAGNAALAQGGHGGGAGGMGSGHSMGSMSHGNEGPSSKASGTGAHGQTAGEILSRNSKLSTKLQSLLPPGTNLQQAENGFKNLSWHKKAAVAGYAEAQYALGEMYADIGVTQRTTPCIWRTVEVGNDS